MLDQEIFGRLLQIGGSPLALKVIQLFYEHVPGKITRLEESLAAADYAEIERLAHSLKSSSANLGLETCRQLASDLERASGGQRDIEKVHTLVPALVEAHDRAFDLLRNKQEELEKE